MRRRIAGRRLATRVTRVVRNGARVVRVVRCSARGTSCRRYPGRASQHIAVCWERCELQLQIFALLVRGRRKWGGDFLRVPQDFVRLTPYGDNSNGIRRRHRESVTRAVLRASQSTAHQGHAIIPSATALISGSQLSRSPRGTFSCRSRKVRRWRASPALTDWLAFTSTGTSCRFSSRTKSTSCPELSRQ